MRLLGRQTQQPPSAAPARPWRSRRLVTIVGGVALFGTTLALVTALPDRAEAATGTITGTVFRDFNADGAMNTTATALLPAVDVGVAGVTVRAFDATGAQAGTTTTGPTGTYSLTYTTAGATTAVRVEFTTPAGYLPGPRGSGAGVRSGTSVQFKTTADTADYGIVQEGDYSEANPLLVTPVHRGLVRGSDRSALAPTTAGTLYATEYSSTGDPAIYSGSGSAAGTLRVLANRGQTGSLWGVATSNGNRVYSSAFFKRHVPVGPSGLGAIYLTLADAASPNADLFVTIPDAGTNPRTSETSATYDWFHDTAAFSSVYKIGLGDLDITPDGTNLYVVNLADRQLYRVPITNPVGGGTPTAGTPVAIPMPLALPGAATPCAQADLRPFGMETTQNAVYASLTCTGPATSNLRGYVYRYDTATGTWGTAPAFEMPIAQPAGGRGTVYGSRTADWGAWDDVFADAVFSTSSVSDPQPLLSDLEFDANGDLTIGIKDRNGDQTGMDAGNTDPASNQTYESFNGGDVLRACTNGSGWTLESAGVCGGRTGYKTANNQGPGGGEFYNDDYTTSHLQTALGSAEQVPGFTDIVATVYDPTGSVRVNGYRKLSNANGSTSSGTVIAGDGRSTCAKCVGTFGKADGLGDVEALLTPAPIEIGNRVWADNDRDGIQGADEPGIAGVTVNLYQDATLAGTTTTDGRGEYVFNATNVTGGVKPLTDYRVAVDKAADRGAGQPLENQVITTADAGPRDTIDADGTPGTGGYPEVALTTGRPGFNDHTYDFGFTPRFDLALRKRLKTGQANPVAPGDPVTFTIEVFNQGATAAASIALVDTLPVGTTLDDPAWAAGSGGTATRTIAGPVAPGASTTVDITLRVSQPLADGTLTNTAEITGATDGGGHPATDVDSTPDTDPTDDTLVDDAITGSGGDEDDHDVATVDTLAPIFDLALRKTTTTSTDVAVGDVVTFDLTVFNQGTAAASSITLTDHIPAQLALATTGNPGWTDNGDGTATATISTTLAPGDSTTVTIHLKVVATAKTITNTAEISAAEGPGGSTVTDIDSTPDTDATDDTLVDNVIDNTGGDEDDHDIAIIGAPAFDLALRKTTTATHVKPGDLVPFTIRVFNQGEVPAAGIVVTDAVPAGFTFAAADNPGWALVAGQPTTTVPGVLAVGDDKAVTISLRVAAGATDATLVNTGEISAATDALGGARVDVDSNPDTDLTADPLVDDEIGNAGGDEDDHDVAAVTLEVFDLALRKTTTADIVAPGDDVPFTITVFNQGNVAATDVEVTDTIPAGLALAASGNAGWSALAGSQVTRTIAGPIAPGAQSSVTIHLTVRAVQGSHVNTAEISAPSDGTATAAVDVDSTPDDVATNDAVTDDVITSTPTGTPADEDDHDVAAVRTFDLALRKTTTTTGRVRVGDHVPFTITVFNQGQVAASGFTVTDTIPAQLTLATTGNAGWTDHGDGTASIAVADALLPGDSTTVTIDLVVKTNATEIDNLAEISAAAGPNGAAVTDVDSTPDTDATDDALVDDVITGTPTGSPADEDDHDIATIGAPAFDLALRKTTTATTVVPGQLVPFTITVFNQGDLAASDIEVTDEIPAAMTFSAADNPGWTLVSGQPTTTIAGPLAPGAHTAVTIGLRVKAGLRGGELTNTAEISAADDDTGQPGLDVDSTGDTDLHNDALVDDAITSTPSSDPADEDDHDVASVTVEPFDLALRKTLATGQAGTVEPGDDATFAITVFNQGEVAATDIVITDTLPAGTTLHDPDWMPGAGHTASITIAGPLAVGDSITVELTLTVDRSNTASTITNTAEISSALDDGGRARADEDSTPDADPTDDTLVDDAIDNAAGDEDDHDVADLKLATPTFDLALCKRLAAGQPTDVRPGQTATFAVTVFNQGDADATHVVVTDTLPAGTTLFDTDWTAGPGHTASITLPGTLAAGDSTTVAITVTVDAGTAPGALVNQAEISAADDRFGDPGHDADSTPDTDATNDELVDDLITGTPTGTPADEDDHDVAAIRVPTFDLALRKTVAGDIVAPGDLVPFTITVFNQGETPADHIVITDTLPAGLSFAAADNPGWTLVSGRPTRSVGQLLAPGDHAAVTIELRVDADADPSTDLVNTAEISAATDDLGVVRPDLDSTPNADATDDALTDDVITSNPSGTPADEDDHDVAAVRLFDLALRKTTITTGRVRVGDHVPFTITVFNQGRVAASDFTVTDTIPSELTLATTGNAGWTDHGDGTASIHVTDPLLPGDSTTVTIDLVVKTNATRIDNLAEISAAAGPNGLAVTDADSTPDTDATDDTLVDNVIDNAQGDEDDHDIATIGAPAFDLALRKTTTATTVAPGDLVPFTITVFNQGDQAATAIEVTDRIPAGTTFAPADNPGWAAVAGQPTTTIDGPLAPGDHTTVTIRLRVVPGATGGTLTNTAEISGAVDEAGDPAVDVDSFADTDLTNDPLTDDVIDNAGGDEDDHDIASATVEPFDLALRKTVATDQATPVEPGDPVTFTITVFNQGTVTAESIEITDTLPAGTTLSDPDWTAGPSGTATTTIDGPLAAGDSASVDITLEVSRPAADGTLTNTAEIADATDTDGIHRADEDSTPDADPTNDTLTDDEVTATPGTGDEDDHDIATVALDTPGFDLALRKSRAAGQATDVRPGQDATFTITVFNQGDATATSIPVTDTLPAGTSLHDGAWQDNGDGTASVTLPGSLKAGASTTVDLTLTVGGSTPPGPLVNTAEISAANDRFGGPGADVDSTPNADPTDDTLVDDAIDNSGGDEDDHDVAAIQVPTFDLALRKTTSADIVAPGDLVPFTITVFNQGEMPAADIDVTDTVPAGFTFSPSDNPGWTLVGGKPTTTVDGPLAPGAQTSVTIRLTVVPSAAAGAYRNRAEISAATDETGVVRTDTDSTPDTDATDDVVTDDVISSSPTGTPADEDDHDVASVRIFDVALRKTTTATQAQVGDTVPFQIEVFNQGTVAATAITVTDTLPAELAFDATANPGWTLVGGVPTTTLAGPLAPGDSTIVTIQLEVVANADRITNQAEISGAAGPGGQAVTDMDSTPDVDPTDDTLVDNAIDGTGGDEDDHDIAVVGSPAFDLALRKTLAAGQPSTVWPGDQVHYAITLFNQGDQAATDIAVTDAVPAGMTFDPADNPGWTSVAGQPTTTVDGPLAPGDRTTVTIVLTVGPVAPSDLTNTAEISAATDEAGRPALDIDSSADADLTGDTMVDDVIDGAGGDEDDHDVATVTVPTFDLALRKTLADGQASTAYLGDPVHYTVTVFNQGSVAATDVVITDTPAAGLSFDPARNPGWALVDGEPTTTVAGPIAPGASASVDLELTVTANGASLRNVAEISRAADAGGTVRPDIDSTPDTDPTGDSLVDDVIDNADGDEDDHDVAIVSAPIFDLALRKTLSADQPSTVYVGSSVSYDLTVFNQGEVTATDIDVIDGLPAGLAFDPARNPGWTEDAGSLSNRIAGPLAPGASARITLRLQVTTAAAATTANLAEIAAAHDTGGRTPPDVDSTPDTDLANDTLVDDVIDNAQGDEDDHDVAHLDTPVWDLALRKTLAPGQSTTVAPGSHVRYRITVLNQGDRAAEQVEVADMIPTGLIARPADNPGWTLSGGQARTTIAGPIEPGSSASVDLDLVVGQNPPSTITNSAEIQHAVDETGQEPTDVDSVTDDDPTNDHVIDDEIHKGPTTGDEDDADVAIVRLAEPDAPVTTTTVPSTDPSTPSDSPTDTTESGSPAGDLPSTGSNVLDLLLVGLALVGTGLGLRRIRRGLAPTA